MKNVSTFAAVLCWLLLASTAFAGSYPTAWSTGVFDNSSYVGTDAAWLPIPNPGACKINTLHAGWNGALVCLGISDNQVYIRPAGSLSWVLHANMGTSMSDVIMSDEDHIYGLGPAAGGCVALNLHSIYLWNGTAWGGSPGGGCLSQMVIAIDGTKFGTDNHYGQAWKLPPGAPSWVAVTQPSDGFAIYAGAYSANNFCVLIGGQLRVSVEGIALGAFQVQPANIDGGASGCEVGKDSLMVWSSRTTLPRVGIQSFNFDTNAWINVSLAGAGNAGVGVPIGFTSKGKGMTFAMNASGVPYHLNDLPGFISGLTSGVVNQCPPPNPCNGSNIHHTGDLNVLFPHGICRSNPSDPRCPGPTVHHQVVAPNVNLNVQSWDISLYCDALFGDPTSVECQPTSTGTVICSVSLVNLGDSSATSPPGLKGLSYYNAAYDHNLYSNVATKIPGGWRTKATCGASDNACSPMQMNASVCKPPYVLGNPQALDEYTTLPDHIGGLPITQTHALNFSELNCELHDGSSSSLGLVWRVVSIYNVKVGAVSCKQTQFPESARRGDPCF